MPRTIETTVYTFEELSDSAKQAARDWWISLLDSYDYAEAVCYDFLQVCERLGVTVNTKPVKVLSGKTRQDPAVYWSGFSSQGDGACFEGEYRAFTAGAARIAAYAPEDKVLLDIAQRLDALSASHPELHLSWKHSGHYYHEYSLSFEDQSEWPEALTDSTEVETALEEAIRDLCRWLYSQLELAYWDAISDAVVDENLVCNEYTFTEDGRRYG